VLAGVVVLRCIAVEVDVIYETLPTARAPLAHVYVVHVVHYIVVVAGIVKEASYFVLVEVVRRSGPATAIIGAIAAVVASTVNFFFIPFLFSAVLPSLVVRS